MNKRIHPRSNTLPATCHPLAPSESSHLPLFPNPLPSQHPQHPQCRICMMETGSFLHPCLCRGSAANVHYQCLKRWIQRKSQDKDGFIRDLSSVQCQMCRYRFNLVTSTTSTFSCNELDQNDKCKLSVVLSFALPVMFFGGAFICGIVLLGMLADTGESLSTVSICLIVLDPVMMLLGVGFLVKFMRQNCVRREVEVVDILEYQGDIDSRVQAGGANGQEQVGQIG